MSDILTSDEAAQIEGRFAAIPPGPWCATRVLDDHWIVVAGTKPSYDALSHATAEECGVAEFIAEARSDIPRLLSDRAALLALLRHAWSGCTGWVPFAAGAGSTTCPDCEQIRAALAGGDNENKERP